MPTIFGKEHIIITYKFKTEEIIIYETIVDNINGKSNKFIYGQCYK